MTRTLADGLRWMAIGAELVETAVGRCTDAELAEDTVLAGWTRKHLVAHVAANADALRNLVHWARTGEVRPMYNSNDQRANDIESGSHREAAELRVWVHEAAVALAADVASLTDEQWTHEVVTAQGRTVPASEIPWMRSREVMVHATDIGAGVTFADLPQDFLLALAVDIVAKRSAALDGPAVDVVATDVDRRWSVAGAGAAVEVRGPLAQVVAYLAGRPYDQLGSGSAPIPALPRWL